MFSTQLGFDTRRPKKHGTELMDVKAAPSLTRNDGAAARTGAKLAQVCNQLLRPDTRQASLPGCTEHGTEDQSRHLPILNKTLVREFTHSSSSEGNRDPLSSPASGTLLTCLPHSSPATLVVLLFFNTATFFCRRTFAPAASLFCVLLPPVQDLRPHYT